MEQNLRSYVSYHQKDWAAFLGMTEFTANNHVSETTNASPFLANQGYHPRMNFATPPPISGPSPARTNEFVTRMSETHGHLRAEMRYAQDKQQQQANSSRTPARRFTLGDTVWLSTKNIKTARPSKKLDHKRLGPFPISEVVSSYAYCHGPKL